MEKPYVYNRRNLNKLKKNILRRLKMGNVYLFFPVASIRDTLNIFFYVIAQSTKCCLQCKIPVYTFYF